MRLRQVAFVARDLEPVVDDACAVLGVEVGFRDPGIKTFGLHNAVIPVGDTFLEVLAPIQPGTTAERLLDRRGGDGGYMVIVQSQDPAADRARVEKLGVRIVWESTLEDIGTIHLHPRDVGGAILSLDWAEPPESWRWAGPRWEQCIHTHVCREIAGVELQAADPAALAARWSEVLDRPAKPAGDGREIALERGAIRFVPDRDGRGEGVSGLDLAVADRERFFETARARGLAVSGDVVEIGGVRVRAC